MVQRCPPPPHLKLTTDDMCHELSLLRSDRCLVFLPLFGKCNSITLNILLSLSLVFRTSSRRCTAADQEEVHNEKEDDK